MPSCHSPLASNMLWTCCIMSGCRKSSAFPKWVCPCYYLTFGLLDVQVMKNSQTMLAVTHCGGHVAFLEGLWPFGHAWVESAIMEFLHAWDSVWSPTRDTEAVKQLPASEGSSSCLSQPLACCVEGKATGAADVHRTHLKALLAQQTPLDSKHNLLKPWGGCIQRLDFAKALKGAWTKSSLPRQRMFMLFIKGRLIIAAALGRQLAIWRLV